MFIAGGSGVATFVHITQGNVWHSRYYWQACATDPHDLIPSPCEYSLPMNS
jgi:hypothetical protein